MSTRFFENLSIGQRIKYMREQRKYTQVELAKKAGVGQAAIGKPPVDFQHHGVAPICLDTVPAAFGDRRGRHHLARQARRAQVAPDHKPARSGFIDHV